MKEMVWDNPNKMHFESAHKAFNKYITCVSAGNVIGGGQLSSHVRPYNETECNGYTSERGRLQEYDLGWILSELPGYVKSYIRLHAIDKGVYAYHFYYCSGSRRIDIGYIVTTEDKCLLRKFYVGRPKADDALDKCCEYITN